MPPSTAASQFAVQRTQHLSSASGGVTKTGRECPQIVLPSVPQERLTSKEFHLLGVVGSSTTAIPTSAVVGLRYSAVQTRNSSN